MKSKRFALTKYILESDLKSPIKWSKWFRWMPRNDLCLPSFRNVMFSYLLIQSTAHSIYGFSSCLPHWILFVLFLSIWILFSKWTFVLWLLMDMFGICRSLADTGVICQHLFTYYDNGFCLLHVYIFESTLYVQAIGSRCSLYIRFWHSLSYQLHFTNWCLTIFNYFTHKLFSFYL